MRDCRETVEDKMINNRNREIGINRSTVQRIKLNRKRHKTERVKKPKGPKKKRKESSSEGLTFSQ
jgi:hypothetical protein